MFYILIYIIYYREKIFHFPQSITLFTIFYALNEIFLTDKNFILVYIYLILPPFKQFALYIPLL